MTIQEIEKEAEQLSEFMHSVNDVISEASELLIEKKRKYGNSALKSIRVFSKSETLNQLAVIIDEKLSRFQNRANNEDEDVVLDLMGYLILLRIKQKELSINLKNK